jgi:hypothetical protein
MNDILNIEPRYIFQNNAYSAAHLAGSTHRVMRRRKLSSTKGNAQGKSKLVTYVPIHMLQEAGLTIDQAHPESNPHVTVSEKTKQASYKNFIWEII